MRQDKKSSKILRARELRREPTNTEYLLWQYLRSRRLFGKKFRRQYIFSGFIIDFYCPEEKLAIELDGFIHLKQKEYDLARQELIENQGINFLRFKNSEITSNISNVLEIIKGELSVPSPSKMEKGEGLMPADEAVFPSPSKMEKGEGLMPADEAVFPSPLKMEKEVGLMPADEVVFPSPLKMEKGEG